MKRSAPDHPKFKRLSRKLKINIAWGNGILERLWHFTAQYAPAGDIGRYSRDEIADACAWPSERGSDELIEALIECCFLDTDETCSFRVHNWFEHSDDATHMKLARAQQFFVTGEKPRFSRLPPDDRVKADAFYSDNSVRTDEPKSAHKNGVRASTLPSPPLPSQALPCPQNVPSSVFGGIGIWITVGKLIERRGWKGAEKEKLMLYLEKHLGSNIEYIHAARILANAAYAKTRDVPCAWLLKLAKRDSSPDPKIIEAMREIRDTENGNGTH